jgi:hypothetical protein
VELFHWKDSDLMDHWSQSPGGNSNEWILEGDVLATMEKES